MALFTGGRRILAEKRRDWGKEEMNLGKQEKCLREISDAFGENKNRKCLQPAHVHYSFCTRSAPHFYEHTTSAERVMNVGTTSDELREHKEKKVGRNRT